jgi:hypothetical protein
VHPNSGSGLRRRACSLLGFAREDLDEGVVVTGSADAGSVATTGLSFSVRLEPDGATTTVGLIA